MQIPFVTPLIIQATAEFIGVIEAFVSELFGLVAGQGGEIPGIIIGCFSIMVALAAWRIAT